jgi:hypothetical protein
MKRIVLVLMVLSIGCTAPEPSRELASERRYLVPDLVIGSYDEENYSLSAVASLTVDPLGRIYVLEERPPEVRVYEPGGAFVRTLGRRGEGPGEFLTAGGLGWLGDTLWIQDGANFRVTLFDTSGVFLGSFQPGARFQPPNPDGSRILTNWPLAGGTTLGMVSPPREPAAEAADGSRPLLRLSREGAVRDTLALLPLTQFVSFTTTTRNGWTSYMTVPSFLRDDPGVARSPDSESIVVLFRQFPEAAEGRFRVVRFSSSGDTILDREYSVAPRPLTEAEKKRIFDWIFSMRDVQERFDRGMLERAMPLPSHYPPVTGAVPGFDGSIWLRGVELPESDSVSWTVLGSNGDPLFFTVVPKRLRLRAATATTVWGVLPDSLDVPFVVRYVVRPRPGLES